MQDVDEALKRLPVEVTDARNQRMKRAVDCSLKKSYLPKDLQDQQTPWAWYVRVSHPQRMYPGPQGRMPALQDQERYMWAYPIVFVWEAGWVHILVAWGRCTLQPALMLHISGAQYCLRCSGPKLPACAKWWLQECADTRLACCCRTCGRESRLKTLRRPSWVLARAMTGSCPELRQAGQRSHLIVERLVVL